MKICFISMEYPPMIIGGIGTYAKQLVKGMCKKDIEVHVITRGEKNNADTKIHQIHVPEILYWRRLFFTQQALSLFHNLNKNHKFDLVHLNGRYPLIKKIGLPTISTIHGPGSLKQMKMLLNLKKFTSMNDASFLFLKSPINFLCDLGTTYVSDKIISPSPSLLENLSSRWTYIGGKQKMIIIPNGIDLKKIDSVKSLPDSVLTNFGLERDNYLLYMGRLSFLKGVDYLIEAFKMIQQRHPNLKLVIAGSGDFEPYLRKISYHMKNVIFLGFIRSDNLKKLLYEASFAVVLPSSVYETSPMVILEAMSHSKPIIATDVGGNTYLIKHGENGFLSKPRNSENLAHYISILCQDTSLKKKMGINGRIHVEKQYTSEQMVSKTIEVYDSLLT